MTTPFEYITSAIQIIDEESAKIARQEDCPAVVRTGRIFPVTSVNFYESIWFEVKDEYNTLSYVSIDFPNLARFTDEKCIGAMDLDDATDFDN